MSDGLEARELTARGRGAIRVLELSGASAPERLSALTTLPAQRASTFFLARLRVHETGELLDEAIVVVDSPTRIELHLHGSPGLVERVADALGVRIAPSTPRTLEERAEQALAASASEAAARMLLDQAQGALRRALDELLARDDATLVPALRELVERGRIARYLVVPPSVVLAGPVNAGKSTLFNALVGRERVVVDASAGTTRDAVVERVLLGAWAVELIDTAGEREARESDGVELAGQRLARELSARSDLVLWLEPAGGAPSVAPPLARHRRVVSRADEVPIAGGSALSALRDPAGARRIVEDLFHEALELPRQPWDPGAGVPFPPELQADLEAWLARPGDARARAAIAVWTRAR